MKPTAAIWGATLVTAILVWPVGANACGYHAPSMIARGVLNWTYPKALHVNTAVWQAEAAGVLAKRKEPAAKDLFAYQKAVRQLHDLGARLDRAANATGPVPSVSMVLIDSMLWARFASSPEGYTTQVHLDGPAPGDVVIVTHGKVVRALVERRLDAARAESHGLLRLYGPLAGQGTVRKLLPRTSMPDGMPTTKVNERAR